MVDPALKGKTFPPFSITVERVKLREFLLAIGDDNPDYDVDDPPLPPTFPFTFLLWGGGGLEGMVDKIGVDMWNVMHAEQEFEHLSPVHIGDTVTGQISIADIYTKKARSGELEFVEFVTSYKNQDGTPVVKERALVIIRG